MFIGEMCCNHGDDTMAELKTVCDHADGCA